MAVPKKKTSKSRRDMRLGVSTQYLVRLPWGQELTVFVQNLGVGERFAPGDAVQLAWDPAHTFGLAGDASAGVESDVVPVGS